MNVKIPDYWTPEQATAVVEFLEELEEALWGKYQYQIVQYQTSEHYRESEVDNLEGDQSAY